MARRLAASIGQLLSRPFGAGLPYFAVTFMLITLVRVYYGVHVLCDAAPEAWHACLANVCVAYALTAVAYAAPGRVFRLVRWCLLALCFVFFAAELFCVLKYHSLITADFCAIVLGTNLEESREFISTYVDAKLLVAYAAALALVLLVWLVARRVRLTPRLQAGCVALVAVACAVALWQGYFTQASLCGQLRGIARDISDNYYRDLDLRDYRTSPRLTATTATHPRNVVVVIGESFSRSHSSLYGYPKATNPRLQALLDRDSAALSVYDHVSASGLHTIAAFQRFMSTWNPRVRRDGRPWYTHTTLPEVLSLAGYHTWWISNQCQKGLWDNLITKYAELCDTSVFVGDHFAGNMKSTLDECVLPVLAGARRQARGAGRPNCYFVHLQGSHPSFKMRYPAGRDRFKPHDYAEYPELQQWVRAPYDNSVLYNDSVVSVIFAQFSADEAVVLYFSDHGLDIYQSADDYCGHAKENDPVSRAAGQAIPFMVYTSPRFRQAYPATARRISQAAHREFSTDVLIYAVMDILGYEFAATGDVARYSPLR